MVNRKIKGYCWIGDDFVQYLKDTRGWDIIRYKEDLKDIYIHEYRIRFEDVKLPSFGSVLFGLGRCGKMWRIMDEIFFANWTVPRRQRRPKRPQAGAAEPHIQCYQLSVEDLGISITCSTHNHQFEDSKLTLEVDESEKKYVINLKVENTGKKDVHFISCTRTGSSDNFTLTNKDGGTQINALCLHPGNSFEICVRFVCNEVGCYRTQLVFTFKQEPWAMPVSGERSIVIHCDSAAGRELAPTQPYTPASPHLQIPDVPVLYGRKPERSPDMRLCTAIGLGQYIITDESREVLKSLRRLFYSSSTRAAPTGLLDEPLIWENFYDKFTLLLDLEELKEEEDRRKYDVPNDERQYVTMKVDDSRNDLLVMEVPGLSENRPSVHDGDTVEVYIPGDQRKYRGYVHKVELNNIKLSFNRDLLSRFRPNMKFYVKFPLMRLKLRLEHRAVELALTHKLRPVLFPVAPPIRSIYTLPKLSMFNRKVEENQEQAQAVAHIVAGSSKPAPYVVFGPPGTGKTMTLVEAIQQIVRKQQRGCHILACAPYNPAADQLWSRITKNVDKHNVYRLYAQTAGNNASADIKPYSNMKNGRFSLPCKEKLMEYKIIVTTIMSAGRLVTGGIDEGHFTHLFVDEAGQAEEPECLIPLAGLLSPRSGQVVLAGDPKQLGPIVRCQLASKFGLGKSFLERIMERYGQNREAFDERFVTKLLRNYRSHPDILRIPNEHFYDGELEYCADEMLDFCKWIHLKKTGFPLIFHGVNGEEQREASSPSYFNRAEVSVLSDYVKKLFDTSGKRGLPVIKSDHIGIIAPFRKQVQKIRQSLGRMGSDIKIGTVEEFQGQERKVILVTTVRTQPGDENCSLGLFKNEKKFNVAMTRAKALLIVVGNTAFLKKDDLWKKFIEYCQGNGGYAGVREDQFI